MTSEKLKIMCIGCKMKAYSCGDLQGTCLHLRSQTLRLDDDKNLLSNFFFLECINIFCDVLISDMKYEG